MQISTFASYPTPAATKSSGTFNTGATNPEATSPDSGVDSLGAGGVEEEFLKFAKMSPLERLRANILRDMGLREEDLKSMSPADRQVVEQKIKQLIEEELHKNPTQTGQLMDVVA